MSCSSAVAGDVFPNTVTSVISLYPMEFPSSIRASDVILVGAFTFFFAVPLEWFA